MYKSTVTIRIEQGLHMRPAKELVNLAKGFSSDITMCRSDFRNNTSVNLKSLFKVLSLGLTYGTTVEISAEGEDAKQALEVIERLLLGYVD